jgi:DNA-binding NarL/FixJ family response regulator
MNDTGMRESNKEMIKVLIADDHKIFRDGLKSLMEGESDIKVIGDAADGNQVLLLLQNLQPDVILMDISMGEAGGIATTQIVREKYPDIKVLVLSMHSESSYILKMLELGASGYMLKDAGKAEMLSAIRTVASGNSYYSSAVSAKLVEALTRRNKAVTKRDDIPLTPRELEMLKLIAEEYSNQEIANKLFISIRTVDTHKRNLLEKLKVKNTAGLVKYALKKGLLE